MLLVSDIWDDAKDVFGTCDEALLFRGVNDAIELLANKGDWTPLMASLDVCGQGQCISLPSEVETPLAVTLDGVPALPRNELYRYHLNGPGERGGYVGWAWENSGWHATMRDLTNPSRLVAVLERAEDNNAELWVYGKDRVGNPIRTESSPGVFVDGYQVPTFKGYAIPDPAAPEFGVITGVRKAVTKGRIRLATINWNPSTGEGLLLGDYLPGETVPGYRRIRFSREVEWARVFFRRRTAKVATQNDFIPLHNRMALVLAMRAVRSYRDRASLGEAMSYEANAFRMLTEREDVMAPPGATPVQVMPEGSLYNRRTDDFGED